MLGDSYPEYGCLVISLDFELQWGGLNHQPADGKYQNNLLGVRQAIPAMLALFREFGIAATWATVGFLFGTNAQEVKDCSPSVYPAYRDHRLYPYDEPTGQSESDDPVHYAPSLIREIRATPRQEIGSHTFSHYYCLAPGQTREAFAADMASAIAIAKRHGIELRSMVFPRNQWNPSYESVLAHSGIVCYRGMQRGPMYRASASDPYLTRALRLLDRYINLSGNGVTSWERLRVQNSLVNIPASRFLFPFNPMWRALHRAKHSRIVAGIRQAAVSRGIYHLWWHPHNFGIYIEENILFLRKILEEFALMRTKYGMRSLNMYEVACTKIGH